MDIIKAIKHPELFKPFLGDSLESWRPWLVALRVLYGLPIKGKRARQLIRDCTGRDPDKLPKDGFDTALFLTGRRSGKSRIASVIGAYEAALAGRHQMLDAGETGIVPIISPSRSQSRIVRNYVRGVFDQTPTLSKQLVQDNREGFTLRNGVRIETLAGDWRTVRGFTLLAAIVDEACFFGMEAESKIKNDTELIRAIRPSLATTNGKLIAISSPYAKRGWSYKTYQRNHGNDNGDVLVWNAPSRTMNPTLDQKLVDRAIAEDPASARAEYLGQWREDVAAFISRDVVESLVDQGQTERMYQDGIRYSAFVDVSGGRGDDAALAIAHREGSKTVLDCLKRYKPPFNPQHVIGQMCRVLNQYGLRSVTGDNYAAEFVSRAFQSHGIKYRKSEKPASQLYLELLPRLQSGEIRLLDDEVLVDQIASLERITRSGGRDKVDHPKGGHDDLANAVAGVCEVSHVGRRRAGVLFKGTEL